MSQVVIYCPECRTEYREGFTMCSDCAVPLVRQLDSDVRRVVSEAVDPLVPLAREGSFELIADLVDQLEKNDIPYVIQAGTAVPVLDDPSIDITSPQPWEARVWVARDREARAREIVDELMTTWRADRASIITKRYFDAT